MVFRSSETSLVVMGLTLSKREIMRAKSKRKQTTLVRTKVNVWINKMQSQVAKSRSTYVPCNTIALFVWLCMEWLAHC